ncbi:hypothetical protein [Geotalea toluenoxydans]|uniref:hypothetical protein n=1 Tax=Geotalea toluenoxydans TaxID=421624 RepID=UPI001FB44E00|nr:hypothetical protein [Geotalea toluenoxydans]
MRFFGSRAGFVAAGVTALLPGHIIYSLVSELDHHVAEPMVCLAIVISLLKAFEHLDEGSPTSIDCLGTGGLMVFSILIWRGSVIFWGIFFSGPRCADHSRKSLWPGRKKTVPIWAQCLPFCDSAAFASVLLRPVGNCTGSKFRHHFVVPCHFAGFICWVSPPFRQPADNENKVSCGHCYRGHCRFFSTCSRR